MGYTQANKVFAIQSTLILVPYHIMIATSYVILLSVLHILDFQLDAEKIKSLARQPLYLTLIVHGQRTTYWTLLKSYLWLELTLVLNPNIKIQILISCFYMFPIEIVGRIC